MNASVIFNIKAREIIVRPTQEVDLNGYKTAIIELYNLDRKNLFLQELLIVTLSAGILQ